MPEYYTKIILPSPILDFSYLEIILENLRLFLVFLISIKIPYASDLLVEKLYQILIGSN
jgi:hypothetical protein